MNSAQFNSLESPKIVDKYTTQEDNKKIEDGYEEQYTLYKTKYNDKSERRWRDFKKLCPLMKDLIVTLYSSLENYLNSIETHPLEEYIRSVDENLPNDHIVRTISTRMGICLEPRNDSYEQFVDDIVEVILNSNFDVKTYRKIIDMDRSEFTKLTDRMDEDIHYDDRLYGLMYASRIKGKSLDL